MLLNGDCLADQVKVDLTEDAGPFMHQGTWTICDTNTIESIDRVEVSHDLSRGYITDNRTTYTITNRVIIIIQVYVRLTYVGDGQWKHWTEFSTIMHTVPSTVIELTEHCV